jgi:predicted PurR-regulated permease PerM
VFYKGFLEEIMNENQQNLRWFGWLVITALMVYLCWKMLEPFIFVLIGAAVLVTVFSPLHQMLLKRVKNSSLCSLLTIVLILTIVIIPISLIMLAVISEAAVLAGNIHVFIQNALAHPDSNDRVQSLLLLVKKYTNLDNLLASEETKQVMKNSAQFVMENTMNILGGAMGMVMAGFLTLFTMYYLFRDQEQIVRLMPQLIPMDRSRSIMLLQRTREMINASVLGVMSIAIIQGTLGGLMFWWLGIPSALVWGVVMVFTSLIPMLGAFIVWLPAALILLLTSHWIKALILVGWGTLVIGMADNVLRPMLIGKKTQMHELLIFFSVMGGLQVFGLLGILLGPVVLSIALALLESAKESPLGNGETNP